MNLTTGDSFEMHAHMPEIEQGTSLNSSFSMRVSKHHLCAILSQIYSHVRLYSDLGSPEEVKLVGGL